MQSFVQMYRQAQTRAGVCSAAKGTNGKGLAFQKEDRAALVKEMATSGKTPSQLATVLEKELGGTAGMHFQRLTTFKRQVDADKLRMAGAPTDKPVVTVVKSQPIRKEVQVLFDQATIQLVRSGVTDEQAAQSYLSRAFINARTAQKIESKAERIVDELRMGDLDKGQVMEVLSRVQARF